jgi:hypothetical protein
MKRIAAVALLAVATLIMAGSALAQESQGKANIPFNFTVNNSVLPAGTYTIGCDSTTGRVVSIADREEHVHILVMPMTDPSGWEGSGTLVFHKYGNQYFLSEIRSADSSTDVQLFVSGAEKRAKAEAEQAGLRVNDNVTIALNTMPLH